MAREFLVKIKTNKGGHSRMVLSFSCRDLASEIRKQHADSNSVPNYCLFGALKNLKKSVKGHNVAFIKGRLRSQKVFE